MPVFTVDDEDSKNLDLSISVLRSTSPIHVQYIQNMGVGATLTISLLHQHKLWGLIACHHYSQKNLSHQVRIAAQLQGHFLTSQIDVRQSNEEYIVSRKSNVALEKFLAVSFQHTYNSLNEIVADPQILEICNASGICVSVKDKFYKLGETPPDDAIKNLIIQLSDQHKVNGFHTHELSNFYRQTNSICNTASGILYHSLSITNNDSIIWFRRENITEVNWGGDPNKAIIKDEKGLHPRNSFKLWKEVVKCKSKPWLKPEINAAANFAYSLQKHVTLLALSAEEEKFRKLTEVLKENNDELENINWISTHDLQEPLRKIQIMSSRLMSYESSALTPKMTDLIVRMDKAANRMQTLLRDILSYTKIKHTNEILEQVDLNVIVAKAVADAEENIRERNAEIILNELPAITGISFLMKQLFTNLLVNSLKFSDKERKQQITISAVEVAEQTNDTNSFYQITISDTGIGFEQKFAESIFQIFNRLHNQSDYQGSGVGLALCKKIMSIHNGNITANGKPGEGAEFILTFPVKLNNIQP